MPIMPISHAILLLSLISAAMAAASPATTCPTATALCVFRNSTAFGSTVTVTEQSTYYSVYSNSIPNHAYKTGINPAVSPQTNTLIIPKTVTKATAAQMTLGTLGVMFNGVSAYSSSDARTVTGCSGNAGVMELASLDSYGAHPDPRGNYHYHIATFLQQATSLGLVHSPSAHSSLLGWAADGLPIYGPYGYASNTSTTITLLKSCYVLKKARTCCTDNTQCGSTTMGSYNEDYEFDAAAFNAGTCHLDEYNTRISKTPEFASTSTRFYVFTINADNSVTFPYIFHGTIGLYGQMMTANNGNTATAGTTATGAATGTTRPTTTGATTGATATGATGATTGVGATTATGATGATGMTGAGTTGAGATGATGVGATGATTGGVPPRTTTTGTTVGAVGAGGAGGTTGGVAVATGATTTSGGSTTAANNNARPNQQDTAATSSEGGSSSSVGIGIGIGAGVGGLIVVAIIGAGVYYYLRASKVRGKVSYAPQYTSGFYPTPGTSAPAPTPYNIV